MALALGVVAGTPSSAVAQVIYKLVDREGRVTYSDEVPKKFDGKVIRLEPDAGFNIVPSAKAVEQPARATTDPGIAVRRRQAREDLDKRVRAAQARVDAARQAMADGEAPRPEEMQVVQRRYPLLRDGQTPPRPNCFPALDPASGIALTICPQQVPGEPFRERRTKLEEELAIAEEELQVAERAYRRGTD